MQPLSIIAAATVCLQPWLVMVAASLYVGTVAGSDHEPAQQSEAVQAAIPQGPTAMTGITGVPRVGPDAQDVVAVVNGRVIHSAELDESIRMPLHDLDLARYQLRLKHLESLISEQLVAPDASRRQAQPATGTRTADVQILLEPPTPPRIAVEIGDNAIRGNPAAPVTLIEFLDYQSTHSQRVQPVLRHLLEDYGPLVKLAVRDLPLHYHHQAHQAAEAAECARAQGEYWRYHDLLLHNQERLSRSRFDQIASTLHLDVEQFEKCLNNQQVNSAISDYVSTARRLGIQSTPTFFINGLYLKGARDYPDFARLINQELVRLGFLSPGVVSNLGKTRCPFRDAPQSTLPITLNGTLVNDDPRISTAFFDDREKGSTQTLKPGDILLDDAELVLVVSDRVYLQRDDRLEYVPLSSSAGAELASDSQRAASRVPDTVLTLRRSDIDAALEERDKLEAALATGSLDVAGKRLLKLREVQPGGFYDLLGLQARDVLMQVDGQWVHNQENPLWNAFGTRSKVTLVVMRKGFPKTFQYLVEDDRR